MICKTCNSEIPNDTNLCPNCNATTEPNTDTPTAKKPFWKTGKASVLSVFITVLLSLCLFFTSFATIFVFNIKSTISTKGITNIITDLFEEISITEVLEDTELKHQIFRIEDILENEYGAKVPPKTMDKILNHSNVKEFFAHKTGKFISECLEQDYAELVINGDHVYDLLIENQDVLHNEINTTLTPEQIRNTVDKTIGDKEHVIITSTKIKENPTTNTFFEEANEILYIVKVCLANSTIIMLILINLLIIFIMIKINLPKGITASAVPLIIVSILYIIIGTALVPSVFSMIGDFEGKEIITKLISNLFNTSTITSIVILIISISALIFKGIKFKKQK